jgi:glutamate dehydrogenase
MTSDVAAASLRNNYQQSLALSLAERRSARDIPDHALLIRALEARGLLDRALEALPSEMELQARARAGHGLTRPELAVLLSYAKIAVQHDILESRVPDDPQLEGWLAAYFPPLLRERFGESIRAHSLRREIIALGLTNAVVNRGGPAMAVRLAAETGRTTADVAHAFMAVREVFDLAHLWQRIDALDGKIDGQAQLALYAATQDLLNAQTLWFLRDGAAARDLAGTIARHKAGLAALAGTLESVLPLGRRASLEQEAARLRTDGGPADLTGDIARLKLLAQAPAITEIAQAAGQAVPETAHVFFEIGEQLRIDDLAGRGGTIATADPYDRQAVNRALGQLAAAQVSFTRAAIRAGGSKVWLADHGNRLARLQGTLAEAGGEGPLTLSRLMVAAGALGDLALDAE